MAVGDVQAPKKLIINNPKIIFLLIMIIRILYILNTTQGRIKMLIFISKLN